MDNVLYDDVDQPVAKEDLSLSTGSKQVGITFKTGDAADLLSDVQLGLVDATPDDGGSVAVTLSSSAGTVDVGLISDAALSYSTTPADLAIGSDIQLQPNTNYTLYVAGVAGSKAILTQQASDVGTGVAGGDIIRSPTPGGVVIVGPNSSNGAAIAKITETTAPGYVTIDPDRSTYDDEASVRINNNGEIVGIYGTTGFTSGYTEQGGIYTSLPSNIIPDDVNNKGDVTGNSSSGAFVVSKDGTTTPIADPDQGASNTHAAGITDSGIVFGSYTASNGNVRGFDEQNGTYSDLLPPGAATSFSIDANNSGAFVGTAVDAFGNVNGFEFANGAYSTIADPNGTSTQAVSINDAGEVAGTYTDSSGLTQGFIEDKGVFTTIVYPGVAGSQTTVGFGGGAINDSGQVVCQTKTADGVITSFVYSSNDGSYTPVVDSLAYAGDTFANSINNKGQVAGEYLESDKADGFEYTPPSQGATPMTAKTLYDDLDQPVTGEARDSLQNGDNVGFTFTTGAASGTLADVKLGLVDPTPGDGGSVAVRLFSTNEYSILDGSQIADLGLIPDSSLSYSTTPVDVPIASTINLAPNTTYLIEMTGVLGSTAIVTQETADAGTGVSGGEESITNASGSGGDTTNANVGAVIAQVTENVVCFASGTLIRTARGDIAVEELIVGDIAVTAAGAFRPIRWLGHRTIDCRAHQRPFDVMPIRIVAHALGDDLPLRDMFVWPGHSICVDVGNEVLISAIALVNGSTIQQVAVDTVTYWHVELDSHDIILAENLPCESYLDMGIRAFFAEADAVVLHACPDAAVTHADFCRPFVADGPALAAVKARLAARAAFSPISHETIVGPGSGATARATAYAASAYSRAAASSSRRRRSVRASASASAPQWRIW